MVPVLQEFRQRLSEDMTIAWHLVSKRSGDELVIMAILDLWSAEADT